MTSFGNFWKASFVGASTVNGTTGSEKQRNMFDVTINEIQRTEYLLFT